ncbi:DgyrCDS12640 [Dimorphilus gyrociliatus]|uniref:DgyrCDS12640 n=1 Tax=Dimorphilus gyrociliatus TaxID=2664684 RepID=A0A7I8W879_9ANNE|nr:DgyrCDS12640 [Dimorphilus gyrociliatus]
MRIFSFLSPKGSVLGQLIARDAAGDNPVFYSISADVIDLLSVDRDLGTVKLLRKLDRETKAEIPVTFFAESRDGLRSPVAYSIKVLDENDNAPTFIGAPYTTSISESMDLGDPVFTEIRIRDDDEGKNSEITLTCDNSRLDTTCDIFDLKLNSLGVGDYRGTVILRKKIDYEKQKKYRIKLTARDGGSPTQKTTIELLVNVQDEQDTPPRFLNTPLSLIVSENLPKSSSVGRIMAMDQDTDQPNAIRFFISDDSEGHFEVSTYQKDSQDNYYYADILTRKSFDRENMSDVVYDFIITAQEIRGNSIGASESTKVIVLVTDSNDNYPIFNRKETEIKVSENMELYDTVNDLNVTVTDRDQGPNSLIEISGNSTVFIEYPRIIQGSGAISLRVFRPTVLDYERPGAAHTIPILLTARELNTKERYSSTCIVTVHVINENDNSPVFSAKNYSVSIRKDRQKGDELITVSATDKDEGKFGRITYSFLPSPLTNLFQINELNGEILVSKSLKGLENTILYVQARDGGGRTEKVPLFLTILIDDPLAPEFEYDSYFTTAEEGTRILSPPVTVSASKRNTKKDPVNYFFRTSVGDFFFLNRTSGELGISSPLPYPETGSYLITIGARHGIENVTSFVNVTIIVRNVNDNSPIFTKNFYQTSVSELAAPGTTVIQIEASDDDVGEDGKVTYYIESGGKDNFRLNSTTGILTVSDMSRLNRENFGEEYILTIIATDGGSPSRTSSSSVSIQVLDENNQAPKFSQDIYFSSLSQDASKGTLVATVSATDSDLNADVQYTIIPSQFRAKNLNGQEFELPFNYDSFELRTNGQVFVKEDLNNPTLSEISFLIEARDLNGIEPEKQIATSKVVVSLERPKDKRVIFDSPLTYTIKEEEPLKTEIFTIAARIIGDPMGGLLYEILPDTDPHSYFKIDQYTGRVEIRKRIDYEEIKGRKRITFQVSAYGKILNETVRGVANIMVNIDDVNDNVPIFTKDRYVFLVKEDVSSALQLGKVTAIDKDEGKYGEVQYSIANSHEKFAIDPLTGAVFLKSGFSLDRETKDSYAFIVQAIDNYEQPEFLTRKTSVLVVVKVTDSNDNAPQFTQSKYAVFIVNTVPIGYTVIKLKATDNDEGLNAEVRYELVPNEDLIFSREAVVINEQTGSITTKDLLNTYTRSKPYLLKFRASDSGTPMKSAVVEVEVTVSNGAINDGFPKFINPPSDGKTINIIEEPKNNTSIILLKAEAFGSDGLSIPIEYSLLPILSSNNYVIVDPVTGHVTTNVLLDREEIPEFQVVAIATTVDNRKREARRSFWVKLIDKDDNFPSIKECDRVPVNDPLNIRVKENRPPGSEITKIKACDPDSAPNNAIYYYMTCGDTEKFEVDQSTGVVRNLKKLDKEDKASYKICVKVSPNANRTFSGGSPSKTVKRNDEITLIINLEDIDEFGPEFDKSEIFSTGLNAVSPPGTEILKLTASDKDGILSAKFQIEEVKFDGRTIKGAIGINEKTGQIYTLLANYYEFAGGEFQVKVKVIDEKGRADKTLVTIHIYRPSETVKFIFNDVPENVLSYLNNFFSELENTETGLAVSATDAQIYHSRNDYTKTTVCVPLVKNKVTLSLSDALSIAEKSSLKPIYKKYNVIKRERCIQRLTTSSWESKSYLWWILIAQACVIAILSVLASVTLERSYLSFRRRLRELNEFPPSKSM